MKKLSIFLCAMTAIAAISCNKEIQEIPENPEPQTPQVELFPMTFTATTADTRTVLDDDQEHILWTEGERISVFDGVDNREFTSGGTGRKVTFSGNAASANVYYALYPYDGPAQLSGTSVTTTLASAQTPRDGSFADGLNINAAQSTDKTTFVFDNVLSVAKFTLDATKLGGKTIKSVKFASKSYPLAGSVVINFGETCTAEPGTAETFKEVSMTDENGLSDGTYFLLVLPNAGGEITMTFESTDGYVARKTATLNSAFTAGHIKNLGTVQGLVWTKVFFYESFDQCDGTGGNDGKWKDISATYSLDPDNSGWTFNKGNGADKCARLGSSGSKGTATTPSIALPGTVTLSFRAGAWDGGSESLILMLSAPGATIDESVTMQKAAFTDYDLTLSEVTTSTSITFAGKNNSNSRFFLDEVLIYVGDKALAYELANMDVTPVVEKELNSTLVINNIKKQFNVGDSFSFGDGVVKATYTNGEERVLTVDDVTFNGFNSSSPADSQTITLTYTEGSQTATGTYTVQIVGTVTGAKYKKVTTFTSGKKYLIVAGNGDSYVLPHPATSGTQTGVSVTISNGEIGSSNETDACAFTITYTKIDNTYFHVISYVSNGTTYRVAGGTNSNLKSITANPASGNYAIWNVTTVSSLGTFRIQNATATNRSILWRPFDDNGNVYNKFGNYSGTQQTGYYNIDLYEYTTE